METKKEFKKELIDLLNKHSIDNDCQTFDYLLGEYIIGCLDNYKKNRISKT